MKRLCWFLLCLLIARSVLAAEVEAPRTLIALYDSREEATPRTTRTHRFLEMPANYLGYTLEYHDINAALPPFTPSVAGIVAWLNPGAEVPDAEAYLDWLEAGMNAGARLVVIENIGLGDRWRQNPTVMDHLGKVLARIGVRDTNRWQSLTYAARIAYVDAAMTGFERPYEHMLPPYMDTRAAGDGVSHLKTSFGEGRDSITSDLIITSPRGGYIASGYALYMVTGEDESLITQWYVDPFAFLREALQSDALPKPDVTTLNGERLFYAQLDGDGFNGISEIPAHRQHQRIAAEVMYADILKPYHDIPFTVSLITGEIDPSCYGLRHSERVARDILALPNVEGATHTRSHPLFWRFFATYDTRKEDAFRKLYPPRPIERSSIFYALFGDFDWAWRRDAEPQRNTIPPPGRYDLSDNEILSKYYKTPRSFACEPFDLQAEIKGSAEYVTALMPERKKAQLISWTGDTSPFNAALAVAREAGLFNLNGGESRINPDFPSITSTPPVGLTLNGERQIYSGNGNEFTYANTWGEERYSGFRVYQRMSKAAESPYRLKPLSLYFHMDAGLAPSTFDALQGALYFIRMQPVAPVRAAEYAAGAAGFFTAKLINTGPQRWRVEERGGMNTIRFDRAALKSVDFSTSTGVLGQRWRHGSLYVALDPAIENPVIALKYNDKTYQHPSEPVPYLIASRWPIKSLQRGKNSLIFTGWGYGTGTMQWATAPNQRYRVRMSRGGKPLQDLAVTASPEGMLHVSLGDASAGEPVDIEIHKAE